MRNQDVFNICHDRYIECRVQLRNGKLNAINPAACANTPPSTAVPRQTEYVLDFDLAGRSALEAKAKWRQRLRLFQVYFCDGVPYQQAMDQLDISPGTFDYWAQEIKKTVGAELRRRGLYPPSVYFREPLKVQREKRKFIEETNYGNTNQRPD
jgi:hypothetical protein